jgi:type II secretory pathway component PulM
MKNLWYSLTKQQKIYLIGGGAIVMLLLLSQFVLIPFFETKKNISKAIISNEKVLNDMLVLGADYKVIKQRSEEIQAVLSRRPKDLTLFSYLEKKAVESGVRNHVKTMSASKGVVTGNFEETAVEMKLEKLTLKQLSNFLYVVEAPQELIKIKKISVTKMKESPEYLSAVMQVVMYQASGKTGR